MRKTNIKLQLAALTLGLFLLPLPAFGQEIFGGQGKELLPGTESTQEDSLSSWKEALSGFSLDELLELEAAVKEEIDSRSAVTYTDLVRGDRGDAVTALQNRLAELGYHTSMITGKYDTETQKSMKRFEKANGLKNDGLASPEDQLRLFSDAAIPAGGAAVPSGESGAEEDAVEAEDDSVSYGEFDYSEAVENPDEHMGDKVAVSGTVVQVIPTAGTAIQVRLATSQYSDIVFVTIDFDLGYNLMDNDKLTIYGTLNGLKTYESVLRETISIPSIIAEEVELQ